jgi:catechol 2,3-dioxygenase-like lactoylglutathione lyase family enzyme
MIVERLEHVNIKCVDLDRSRGFYEGLGLRDGERPPFASTGAWFYAGDIPVIHLVQAEPGSRARAPTTGAIDHIAFHAYGLSDMRARLAQAGISFRETQVPRNQIVQLFVKDPDGVVIELNCPAEVSR